jgi:hypothetical protein
VLRDVGLWQSEHISHRFHGRWRYTRDNVDLWLTPSAAALQSGIDVGGNWLEGFMICFVSDDDLEWTSDNKTFLERCIFERQLDPVLIAANRPLVELEGDRDWGMRGNPA